MTSVRFGRRSTLLVAVAALLVGGARERGSVLPEVHPNDNRTPAGRMVGDSFEVHLAVAMARWHPEADSGAGIEVAAIGEEGRPPEIPAPLIRVRVGTIVIAHLYNALTDSTIVWHGLAPHPGAAADSVVLHPGERAAVHFVAGLPGTYLYGAVLGRHKVDVDDERETTGGAFIVDPPGPVPPDRVFVMNVWGRQVDSTRYINALTINGRSWPYDERITATVGDTLRWRWVNANGRGHPMHLHGFFFRVDSRGDVGADTVYAPAERRLAVTEPMTAFSTMAITWVPEREGNWLFHCHIGYHVTVDATLEAPAEQDTAMRMAHDPERHMAGLVLGISVAPGSGAAPAAVGAPHLLRLYVQQGPRRGRAPVTRGYVLQRGDHPPARDSVAIPGPVLVLTRGEPATVRVVNRLSEATAVHWHGLELESWSDGVAGWSGVGARRAPWIAPGASFDAHLTLARAGTFIYHTHMNDLAQLTAGMYGAIVVLEPGHRFQPAVDHVFIAGSDGPADPPHLLVNGDSLPAPQHWRAGIPHRLRLINMQFAARVTVRLLRDTTLVGWRPVAKDGADLPPGQSLARPAVQPVRVGETYDFEWTPSPGRYRLVVLSEPESQVVFPIVAGR